MPVWSSAAHWLETLAAALRTPQGEELRAAAKVSADTLIDVAAVDARAADSRTGRGVTTAHETVAKALGYAYRDRKARKRDFRRLWIVRISAACELNQTSYSKFMGGLKKASVTLDRKMLADLAVRNPEAFTKLVAVAKG